MYSPIRGLLKQADTAVHQVGLCHFHHPILPLLLRGRHSYSFLHTIFTRSLALRRRRLRHTISSLLVERHLAATGTVSFITAENEGKLLDVNYDGLICVSYEWKQFGLVVHNKRFCIGNNIRLCTSVDWTKLARTNLVNFFRPTSSVHSQHSPHSSSRSVVSCAPSFPSSHILSPSSLLRYQTFSSALSPRRTKCWFPCRQAWMTCHKTASAMESLNSAKE